MLYNLEWLNPGKTFPPISQRERLSKYHDNRLLFENEHAEVFKENLKRLEEFSTKFGCPVSFAVIFNYQKLLSLKTADLVCGEAPDISCGESENENDKTIASHNDVLQKIVSSTKLVTNLYKTILDISRYGDSIWRIYKSNETGKGTFCTWDPAEWFPVVAPDDKSEVLYDVLCWLVETPESTEDKPVYELYCQIHSKGEYEFRRYSTKGGVIGQLLESRIVKTGLSESAVVHFHNVVTSDSLYGHDDYETINSIISELMVRIGQVSRVLDKHAEPSMYGSSSNLDQNSDGSYSIRTGDYFICNDGESPPGYLTWDGNLENSFKQIDILLNQLYIISEMGAALLGSMDNGAGTASSGEALRLKMTNPLTKASRLVMLNSDTLKRALSLITELGFEKIQSDDIKIKWQDGLPTDELRNAQICTERINNGTFDEADGITYMDGIPRTKAEEKAEAIRKKRSELSYSSNFTSQTVLGDDDE